MAEMLEHMSEYLYDFINLFLLLLDAQSQTFKHVNGFVAYCTKTQEGQTKLIDHDQGNREELMA